jgi:integrase
LSQEAAAKNPKMLLDITSGPPKRREADARSTFHASLLIYEGVHPKKISERLGHSSINLTMDTYGQRFEGSDRDSAEKMEKLFGGELKVGCFLTMPARRKRFPSALPRCCALLRD